MNTGKGEHEFFGWLLFAAAILTALIFLPYLTPLTLAGALAIAWYPVHRRIAAQLGMSEGFRAFVSVVLLLLIVLTPLTYFGFQVFREVLELYAGLQTDGGGPLFVWIEEVTRELFPEADIQQVSTNFEGYVQEVVAWLFRNLGPFFSGLTNIIANLILGLIALYYFLKDGANIRTAILRRMPVAESKHGETVLSRIESAVNSVIRGSLVVAVAQGILAGVGFWIFGIPNPAFWGSLTVVMSLIPLLGTTITMVPAVAYLLAVQHGGAALGLGLWAILVVGLVDNFLRPQLMKRDVGMHPFLILLSVVGGISFFGPVGFILGPVSLTLFFAFLDIYSSLIADTRKS